MYARFCLCLVGLFALTCTEKGPVAPTSEDKQPQAPAAAVAVAQAAPDLWVYDDALQSPWINASWSATIAFNSTEQVYAGTNSIKTALTSAWGALSLHHGNWGSTGVDPSSYTSVDFAAYGATSGTNLSILLENDAGQTFPVVNYGTIPAGQWTVVSIAMSQVNPNGQTINRVSIQDVSGSPRTFYVDNFRFVGITSGGTAPSAPALASPANGATGVATNPTLSWNASSGATSYRVHVSTSSAFSSTIVDQGNITGTSHAVSGLSNSTTYYWRVNASNSIGTSDWSATASFTTVAAPAPGTSLVMYEDALQSPWINASWSATVTFNSTEQVYAGTNSIRAAITSAWGALSVRHGSWGSPGINPTSYQSLDFVVHGGVSGTSLSVFFENDAGQSFPKVNFGTIPAAQWTVISIPMSQLNPNGQTINRVDIQDISGSTRTFYVDNLRLVGTSSGGTPPAAPTLGSPADGATGVATNPTLTWNASSGAASYRLQVSTGPTFASTVVDQSNISGTSFAVIGLSNSTTYYWRVNATNSAGTSDWSAVRSFSTVSSAPAAPTPVSPADGATGVATNPMLSWNASSGATSYQVQVSTNSAFTSTLVDQSGITGTSYAVSGLSNSTTYYWRANATNSAGTSDWSAVRSFTTVSSAPTPPTLVSPANGATGVATSPTLSWNASSGATSYGVQVSTSSTFSSTVVDQSGITGTSHAVSGLSNSTTYYWRVNATNSTGTSAWSAVRSFTTVASAPLAPTLASPANGATGVSVNPTLTWNASSGASSYGLQVSTSSAFTSTVVNQSNITGTSYAVSGLSYSTTYYWRVNASNSAGTSGWSSVQSFTTAAPPAALAPDLTVDADRIRLTLQIRTMTFSSSSCAVVEGCAEAGTRKILRFEVTVPNFGTADLFFGNPADNPQLFHWSPCHGHYHFEEFAEYRLLNASNQRVILGRKQAFCLLDSKQYWSGYPSHGYKCDYQGISVGWADVYARSLECQWLDITGIPAGDYIVEVEVNIGGRINEGANTNPNIVRVPFRIP